MRFLTGAALGLASLPALAQQQAPPCFPHAQLVAYLADVYKETIVGEGATDAGMAAVLFASDGGMTWTLIIRSRETSCIVATGNGWASRAPKERGA